VLFITNKKFEIHYVPPPEGTKEGA
jgi:hypothetical protein